jgi:hypothetical protein
MPQQHKRRLFGEGVMLRIPFEWVLAQLSSAALTLGAHLRAHLLSFRALFLQTIRNRHVDVATLRA